jgi:hypothetical protein
MEKLIKQFIEKLDKDGVFSEDQIKEFESFGAIIHKMIEEAEEKGMEKGKEEAEEEAEKDMEEVEESFKRILSKIDECKEAETKLAIMKFKEHAELTVKEEEIVEGLSKYLQEAVAEHLPEQAIIDYAELDRLRTTISGIREAVVVTDTDVQTKVASVIEEVETELNEKSTLLNDAIARNIDYKAELESLKAEKVLESKLQDIPEFEQAKIRKHFNESTAEEIDAEFDNVLEQIKLKEYDIEIIAEKNTSVVKEDLEEEAGPSEMDRYAQYAERWLPQNK